MLNLGDKFEFLCFALDVDVVDLEGRQHQPHSLKVVNDIIANNDVEEEIHMVKDETPQRLSELQGMLSIIYLEVDCRSHNIVNEFHLALQFNTFLRQQNLVRVEIYILGHQSTIVQGLLVSYGHWIKLIGDFGVNFCQLQLSIPKLLIFGRFQQTTFLIQIHRKFHVMMFLQLLFIV